MHKKFVLINLKKPRIHRPHGENGQFIPIPISPPITIELPKYRKKQKLKLISIQDNRCYWCCRPIMYPICHIDHVIPRSRGGTDMVTNLKATCAQCNRTKQAQSPMDFALFQLGATKKRHYRLVPTVGKGYRTIGTIYTNTGT